MNTSSTPNLCVPNIVGSRGTQEGRHDRLKKWIKSLHTAPHGPPRLRTSMFTAIVRFEANIRLKYLVLLTSEARRHGRESGMQWRSRHERVKSCSFGRALAPVLSRTLSQKQSALPSTHHNALCHHCQRSDDHQSRSASPENPQPIPALRMRTATKTPPSRCKRVMRVDGSDAMDVDLPDSGSGDMVADE